MATFEIIEGAPGQGKSLYTARIARKLYNRNFKWYEKSGIIRKIASNQKYSEIFLKGKEQFFQYWSSPKELCDLKNVDVIWDEIATELDARNFANLPYELKVFLSQYRKRGIDVYANTQDFSMIDARARLMVTEVLTLSKVLGSRDPSATKPPVKNLWGLILVWHVINHREPDIEKKKRGLIPDFFFIEKEDVERYDTKQGIEAGQLPPKKLRKFLEIYEGDEKVKPFERAKYI